MLMVRGTCSTPHHILCSIGCASLLFNDSPLLASPRGLKGERGPGGAGPFHAAERLSTVDYYPRFLSPLQPWTYLLWGRPLPSYSVGPASLPPIFLLPPTWVCILCSFPRHFLVVPSVEWLPLSAPWDLSAKRTLNTSDLFCKLLP